MTSRSLIAKIFLACIGLAAIAFTQSASATTFTPIRVNAGGPSYTDSQGQVWSADIDSSGGQVYSTTSPISNTSDPTLYQTERYGAFSYQFPVPNGSYNVLLKFAEIYFTSPGQRVFNVAINGTQVLTNFDIVAATGPLTAIDESFPVTVTNGTITVQFITGSANFPKVSAIAVTAGTTAPSSLPIRVHAGGGAYTDSLGQAWTADTGFTGGDIYSTTSTINNTPDPALYQTERYGAFSYQFTVPNGNYNVLLKFAEIYFTSAGERIFGVSINGNPVLTNFDIVAAAGAPLTAIDKTFPVTVTNETIAIQFIVGSANFPKVSAIQITEGNASTPSSSTTAPTSFFVNAGGEAYTDSLGQTWSADTDFSGGNVYSTTSSISNTPDPTLYQTERYGAFSYQFPVPNGNYNVLLKFAEIYFASPGQRIFSVTINGTQVLTNFDIVAAAGAPLTAIDKTFPVTVSNGAITVQFIPGSANWPKVSAISVTPSSTNSNSGSTAAVTTAQGQLSLNATSFAFGNVNVGTSASQSFTLSNTGASAITFSGVSVSGAGFNATGASNGLMLNPGQSATLNVTFTPASAATVTGSVTFTTNATDSSAAIALSGTGVQPPPASYSTVLTWDASASSGVVGYYVFRGAASAGPFTALNATPVSTTTYTDNTVQSGQSYYYVVTSVNSSNVQSPYSNPVSVTVP